jgi:NADH-quinone oxidoreductase subunit J
MVLFIFVVMLLNPGPRLIQEERVRRSTANWVGACVVAVILLVELIWSMRHAALLPAAHGGGESGPVAVGIALYGPYLLGVEIASVLLLSALVGAWHTGRRRLRREREDVLATRATSPDSGGDSVFHGIDRSSRTP